MHTNNMQYTKTHRLYTHTYTIDNRDVTSIIYSYTYHKHTCTCIHTLTNMYHTHIHTHKHIATTNIYPQIS